MNAQPITIEPRATAKAVVEKGGIRKKASDNPLTTMGIDICQISANMLYFNIKRKDTEFFQTSIYEIDRVIGELEEASEDPKTWDLVKKLVPKLYSEYKVIFSKTKADTLPPHR